APAHTAGSYSGDIRLTRSQSNDVHRRELTFDVRGRRSSRNFGGDSVTDLGTLFIHDNVVIAPPALQFSPRNHDRRQQTGVGVDYREMWKDRLSLSVGALWTDYSRRLETPDQPAARESTTKVLPTVSVVSNAFRPVTLYGSYTRGLEDSAIAPSAAANRGE